MKWKKTDIDGMMLGTWKTNGSGLKIGFSQQRTVGLLLDFNNWMVWVQLPGN